MTYRRATIPPLVLALLLSLLATLAEPVAAQAPYDDPDDPKPWAITNYPPTRDDNAILKWDEELLQAVRANPPTTGPVIHGARDRGAAHHL